MRIVPRMRACRFSSASPGSVPANVSARAGRGERLVRRLRSGPSSSRCRGCARALGVGDAVVARVARRHQHAGHAVGAERVGGDRGDERRVDAAGQPDEHPFVKPFFVHVVAGAERRVPRRPRAPARAAARRAAGRAGGPIWVSLTATSGSGAAVARPRGSSSRRRNAGRTSRSTIEQVLDELRRAGRAARRSRRTPSTPRRRRARPGRRRGSRRRSATCASSRAGREHRLALVDATGVVRRRVDVDDQLGAAGGLGDDRTGRAPRVLADRDADLHAAR